MTLQEVDVSGKGESQSRREKVWQIFGSLRHLRVARGPVKAETNFLAFAVLRVAIYLRRDSVRVRDTSGSFSPYLALPKTQTSLTGLLESRTLPE